jgi:hypothetical protein
MSKIKAEWDEDYYPDNDGIIDSAKRIYREFGPREKRGTLITLGGMVTIATGTTVWLIENGVMINSNNTLPHLLEGIGLGVSILGLFDFGIAVRESRSRDSK